MIACIVDWVSDLLLHVFAKCFACEHFGLWNSIMVGAVFSQ